MLETGKRKDFSIRNLEYFEDMYDLFAPRGEIKYLVTRLNLKKHIASLKKEKEECEKSKNNINDSKFNAGKIKAIDEQIDGIEKK